MINLNAIDVNELVLKLSTALFNALNGKADDEFQGTTKFTDEEAEEIIEARKIAREIAFEKKFIPLNLDVPKRTSYWAA